MISNKGRSKTVRPEELESLVDKLFRKVRENLRWVLCIGGFILILGALGWGYTRYSHSMQEKASYAYYLVSRHLSEDGKDIESNKRALHDFLKNYNGYDISLFAKIDLLRLSFETKSWEEVIRQAEDILKGMDQKHSLRVFVLQYLAMAYDRAGKHEEALKLWDEIANIVPDEWKREIYWRKSLSYKALGRVEEMKETLKKALEYNGIFPTRELIQEEINNIAVR